MAESRKPARAEGGAYVRPPRFREWSKTFLSHLASSSNVTESARLAGVSTQTAYEMRRANGDFRNAWFEALCEGFDHLEMETLHRLRVGEIKPAAGARKGVRVFDNASALRLMAAHRETVAKMRAQQDNRSEEDILASLNEKLSRLRANWLAARGRSAEIDEDPEDGDQIDRDAPQA